MKILTHAVISMMSLFFLFSCSDEDVRLYHPPGEGPEEPEPTEKFWLLEHIGYPSDNSLDMVWRSDIVFSYTDETWMLKSLDNAGGNFIKIEYKDKDIIYSMKNETNVAIRFDTLLIRTDGNNPVESALHTTYYQDILEGEASKIRIVNDSSYFTYDAQGYLKKLERFNESGDDTPTYWEEYTVTDGNVTGVKTSAQYTYTYTYGSAEYSASAAFCYEMPLNTVSISQSGNCWLLTNLPFFSEYLGKRNKNNVIRTVITHGHDSAPYADITYQYEFDENKQVKSVKMSGLVNNVDIPDDYTTTFSYLEKEKK